MLGIEWVLAAIGIAIAVAFYLLQGRKPQNPYFRNLDKIEEYRPPVKVVLDYRNSAGTRYTGSVAIVKSLRHRNDGRLYLLGFSGKQSKPRVFRVDRIVSMKTTGGKPIEKRRFLVDRLGLPDELSV